MRSVKVVGTRIHCACRKASIQSVQKPATCLVERCKDVIMPSPQPLFQGLRALMAPMTVQSDFEALQHLTAAVKQLEEKIERCSKKFNHK